LPGTTGYQSAHGLFEKFDRLWISFLERSIKITVAGAGKERRTDTGYLQPDEFSSECKVALALINGYDTAPHKARNLDA